MKKFSVLILALAALFFYSCETAQSFEEVLTDTNIDVFPLVTDGETTNGDATGYFEGADSCFTFVFPIEVEYPDSTIVSYDDLETMTTDLDAWVAAQGEDFNGRPHLVLPVEIIIEGDTEATSIDNPRQIRRVIRDCIGYDGGGHEGGGNNGGHHGGHHGQFGILPEMGDCFTVQYPVELEYADGTVESYADADALTAALEAWRATATQGDVHPTLVFPITIVTVEDGETIEIGTREDLRAVISGCASDFEGGHGNHHNQGGMVMLPSFSDCFTVQYPVELEYADGTVESYADADALTAALEAWRENATQGDVHPTLVFPIEVVTVEDGETVEIGTREDLRAVISGCIGDFEGGSGDHDGHGGDHGDHGDHSGNDTP